MKIGLSWAATISMAALMGTGCVGMKKTETLPGQHPRHLEQNVLMAAELNYLIYIPEGYPAAQKDWPLMLFLHGAGERGNDLEWVKRNGPPKLVEEGTAFPFIIVSPQCPEGSSWVDAAQIISLNALVDDLVATYPIDESRIYLTGLSMGGFGTWSLAATYPDRFAAIAPICGGGTREARRLSQLPIWVFHGARDKVIPIYESQKIVDLLKERGSNVKFTIYPETGHNSWIEAYNNPELYEWLLQHSQNTQEKMQRN